MTCNHKSAGVYVEREGQILLIERGQYPAGFACPAGHVDDDTSFEIAAKRELEEETGYIADTLELLYEGRRDNNPCKRGSTWHYWNVFKADISGNTIENKDEVKQIKWVDKEELQQLSKRTLLYIQGDISEDEWERDPGLEVVWFEIFKEIEVL